MSIDNKYGVPISRENDTRAAILQPKFNNRFRVFFEDFGGSGSDNFGEAAQYLTAQVESFSRPSFEFNNMKVTSAMGFGNVAGRPTFSDIKFVIRDDITNSAVGYVLRHMQSSIDRFYPQKRKNAAGAAGAAALVLNPSLGRDIKFRMLMEEMDGRTNHTSIMTWCFNGCVFSNIQFSDSSYEDESEIAKITISCNFDSMTVYRPERKIFADREYDDNGGNSTAPRRVTDLNLSVSSLESKFNSMVDDAKSKVKSFVSDIKKPKLPF